MNTRSDLSKIRGGNRFLNHLKKNYPGLLDKYFPVIDTAAENKKKLLELEHRPSQHSKDPKEHRLSCALTNYTRSKSRIYDPTFDKLIRKTKPGWFIDTVTENKKKLLGLTDRPSQKAKDQEERRLGYILGTYTRKTNGFYDPEFDKLIRKTKPGWFIDTATENKKKLLGLRDRPSKHSKDLEEARLGQVLVNYTNESSNNYDLVFDKLIRKTKQDWFIDTVSENKKKLLELTKKPSINSKYPKERGLARALGSYIHKSQECYDSKFDKLIRKTKPEWFIGTAAENKKRLLEMSGRPSQSSEDSEERRIAFRLSSYTNPRKGGSYDPEFDKLIRKTKPHWFK
jgi:hypothetical protein